ncbi:hypothetical protein BH24BAC1_BH24BAC1_41470 [soil metagenome]
MQEFVFRKNDLLKLINSSPDSQMIAIRIDYEALGTGGNEFKATIKASAVPSAAQGYGSQQEQQQQPESGQPSSSQTRGQTQNGDNAVHESFSAEAVMEVSGCPNPPGCGSDPTS